MLSEMCEAVMRHGGSQGLTHPAFRLTFEDLSGCGMGLTEREVPHNDCLTQVADRWAGCRPPLNQNSVITGTKLTFISGTNTSFKAKPLPKLVPHCSSRPNLPSKLELL